MKLHRVLPLLAVALLLGCAAPAAIPTDSLEQSPSPALPSPTGTSASPATADPSAAPEPSAPASPTASEDPSETSGPPADTWSGPEQISERFYQEPSMIIDDEGYVHIAAVLRHDINYLTNSGGSWTRERLSRAAGPAGDLDPGETHTLPRIALDSDGSLAIVFASKCRACAPDFPNGVHFVTNRSGSWSRPERITGDWPSDLVLDNGAIHLAYNDGDVAELEDLADWSHPLYGTNGGGHWAATELAPLGEALAVRLMRNGSVRVLHTSWEPGRYDRSRLAYLVIENGSITSRNESPLVVDGGNTIGTFDESGNAHVLATVGEELVYSRTTDGRWSEPLSAQGDRLVADPAGAVHTLWGGWDDEADELFYATNRSGTFEQHSIGCCAQYSTLSVDGAGRVHIFYSSQQGSWYAVGPAE